MVLLGHGLPPARHLYAALLSGGLCALCWALGQAVLEVVFTERLLLVGPGEADPNAPLLAVLGSGSPMLQVGGGEGRQGRRGGRGREQRQRPDGDGAGNGCSGRWGGGRAAGEELPLA